MSKEKNEEKGKENDNYKEIVAALLETNNLSEQPSFFNSFIFKNPQQPQQENDSFSFGKVNTVNKNEDQIIEDEDEDENTQKISEDKTDENKIEKEENKQNSK